MSEKLELIIENAIKEEIFFQKLYVELANRVEKDSLKEILLRMSEQEELHREKLENLSLNKIKAKLILYRFENIDIQKEISSFPIPDFENIKDVLKFAIDQEIAAKELYEKLRDSVDDMSIKKVFSFLANEEKIHERVLTEELMFIND